MKPDPIVAEVHRIRESLAAKFDYDITALLDDIRSREAASGVKLRFPKDKVVPTEETSQRRPLAS